jgi:hypothetical protein
MTREEMDERKRRRERRGQQPFVTRMHKAARTVEYDTEFQPKPDEKDPSKYSMYWLDK